MTLHEQEARVTRRGHHGSSEPGTDAEHPEPAPDGLLPLYTPARAAELLAVRESWLRRSAAARAVPCTFVGKHLRFSHADVLAIAADGARPVVTRSRPRLGAGPGRGRRPADPQQTTTRPRSRDRRPR